MSISKEIFGIEKLKITNEENTWVRGYEDGFNKCIDNIDQHELSEEELAKIINSIGFLESDALTALNEDKKIITKWASSYIAQAIKQNQHRIFVRKT